MSDFGAFPENRAARDRIFAPDRTYVEGLFHDIDGLDLHETTEALVSSIREQWDANRWMSPKQLRTLEDVVRRGR